MKLIWFKTVIFHQGICYKSVAKAGGRERKWQCCLATSTCGKQGKVLLPRVYKACAAAAVAVGITTTTALQEARCLHSYWHGKSPRVHSSTEVVVLAKAAKASSHLGWPLLFHSCSTIAAQSAVLTARSQEFCAAEAAEVATIAEIASVKSPSKNILSDLLPVLPILAKQSGKCSFQVPPQKRVWQEREWSWEPTDKWSTEFKKYFYWWGI